MVELDFVSNQFFRAMADSDPSPSLILYDPSLFRIAYINTAMQGLFRITGDGSSYIGRSLLRIPEIQGVLAVNLMDQDASTSLANIGPNPLLVMTKGLLQKMEKAESTSPVRNLLASLTGGKILSVDIIPLPKIQTSNIPHIWLRGTDITEALRLHGIGGLAHSFSGKALGGILNGKFEHTWTSDDFLKLVGYERAELMELGGLYSIVHHEDLEKLAERDSRIRSNMPVDSLDIRVHHKSGRLLHLRLDSRGAFLDDSYGGLVQLTHIIHDRTPEVEARYLLQQRESEIRNLLDNLIDLFRNIPFATILIDHKGEILSRNPASSLLSEDMLGKRNVYGNVFDYMKKIETVEGYGAALQVALDSHMMTTFEFEVEDLNGNSIERRMRVFFVPTLNKLTGEYEAYVVGMDITEEDLMDTDAKTYSEVLHVFQEIMEHSDEVTSEHTSRVATIMENLCSFLGFGIAFTAVGKRGAILHDIGKIKVPDIILKKPGKLSEDEIKEMRRHVEYPFHWFKNNPLFSDILEIIINHHFKWDGSGYGYDEVDGMNTKKIAYQIPLLARIFSIIDSYDAIRSERPYKKGVGKIDALIEIAKCAGKDFDPYLSIIFIIEKLTANFELDYPVSENNSNIHELLELLGDLIVKYQFFKNIDFDLELANRINLVAIKKKIKNLLEHLINKELINRNL